MSGYLYVFNPEHDFALALGRRFYSPPAFALRLAREMEEQASEWIRPEDDVLSLYPESLDPGRMPDISNTNLKKPGINKTNGKPDINKAEGRILRPWGWDFSVKRRLSSIGFSDEYLPSDEWIDSLRELSHRRTSIEFCRLLNTLFEEERANGNLQIPGEQPLPEEFRSAEEAMMRLKEQPDSFLKMPWSSSGRGVISSTSFSREKTRQWIEGCIKKQGSVIIEPAAEKVLDFATEWEVSDGNAEFLGVSLFQTEPRGQYSGNQFLPQEQLIERITEASPLFTPILIKLQKSAIETLIAPTYSGPLGIDMLADKSGDIRACIELNLRMTMGMVALKTTEKTLKQKTLQNNE